MITVVQKTKAIRLRKEGFSYREILRQVPVAKSTLSLWLRAVGLSKKQKQRLTEKRLSAGRRGAEARRNWRIINTKNAYAEAKKEATAVFNRELWLAGVMLYWAEGSKQKATNVSQSVKFSNSDPLMIRLFLKWLTTICKIEESDIYCELYIHRNSDIKKAVKFWNKRLAPFPLGVIYYKWDSAGTNRKNVGEQYNGLITARVRRSTSLNRKISAWVEIFLQNCGVV